MYCNVCNCNLCDLHPRNTSSADCLVINNKNTNKCLLCPATQVEKDRNTLIEQSSILLKQSVSQLCLTNLLSWRMHAYQIILQQTSDFGHQSYLPGQHPSLRNPGSAPGNRASLLVQEVISRYSMVFHLTYTVIKVLI